MVKAIRIGLIGDRNLEVRAHVAIPRALELAGKGVPRPLEPSWLSTISLAQHGEERLAGFSGLWCVPGSPYVSMEGALKAIRYARERGVPFLGTCGGFQHVLLEFARNVLGMPDAEHAETSPGAAVPLIAPLACPMVEASGMIKFRPGSLVARCYGRDRATEEYHCSYGFNSDYRHLLEESDLLISGEDEQGSVRVVERTGGAFFMATLFQPERSAFRGIAHPVIHAFASAAFEQWHRLPGSHAGG